ncbi:MAG: hypothetical protein EOO29_11475 [Comamonadaceae bacterium]|nr:MAG: hypothetical protein EOO29_11475 [Comamonadaceae bacterium]
MTRDVLTLPLFADAPAVMPHPLNAPTMPAAWPPKQRESFAWWCRHGNNEMCSAVLWQSNGFARADADALVKHLHQQPKFVLMTESPACAHFARPMATAAEAQA